MLLGYIWLLGTFVNSSSDIKINVNIVQNCCRNLAVRGLSKLLESNLDFLASLRESVSRNALLTSIAHSLVGHDPQTCCIACLRVHTRSSSL